MLLSEIKDQINLLSRLEYIKTGRQVIEFPDKELAFLISSVQQDIQRRLSVVTTSYTITLDGSSYYELPKNFGKQILTMLGDIELEQKDFHTVNSYTNPEGNWYAIQVAGNRSRFLTGATTGTVVFHYHPDLGYYRPSLGSTQDWGTFTGVVFTGYPILPDRYDMALIYGVMKFIFPEFYPQYEKELKSLRESRVFSGGDTLGYNLGNVDEHRERLNSTTVISEVTVPTDQPTKRIRFNVTDNGSDASESFEEGFSDSPEYTNNTSTIVVESDDFLTTSYIHVEFSNDDWTWGISGNEITLTPPTDTGWGTCEIIIEIW